MVKRYLGIAMIVFMVFSLLPVGALATDNISEGTDQTVKFIIGQKGYQVGNKLIATDVAPYIKEAAGGGGRTMVPVAFVAPALGTETAVWLPAERAVQIKKGDKLIKITLDSKELLINGKAVEMDVAAEIKDLGNGGGRTMLPIAFIAKALEVGYEWNGSASSVDFFGYTKSYEQKGSFGPESGTQTIEGNVVIKSDGVILQNITVKGNLIVAEEVGAGDVTLNNVIVRGETLIRGGGKDSIHINGGRYSSVTVENVDGQVRIVATDVSGLRVVVSENAAGEEIILEGNFAGVSINAPEVTISTQGTTTIQEVTVGTGSNGCNLTLGKDTVVEKMVLGSQAEVNGTGTIKTAEINADGVIFTTAPQQQIIAPTVQTQPVTPPRTSGGSGGNRGNSGSSTITATAVTGADVGVTKGSIDFAYSFTAGSTPITFGQVKAAPYYLDLANSTVQLKTEGLGPSIMSTPIALSTFVINDVGEVVFSDFNSMAQAFGNFQNGPTHIKLHLVSKTSVNGVAVSNPWTYDTDWLSFASAEMDVFHVYGDKESLLIKNNLGLPISGAALQNIEANLTLDTQGVFGSTITWASSNTNVLANNGSVTRPANGAGNASVNLTATLTKGALTETKVFPLVVLAEAEAPAPVISTASTIANGAVNPSVVVTLSNDTFTEDADLPANWTGSVGTTGLMGGVITKDSATQITFNLVGTAAAGTLTLQADAEALVGGVASNTLAIIVPAPIEISAVADINDLLVDFGTAIADVELPITVEVTLADQSTRNLSVTWDGGTPVYDGSAAATYQFTGTIALPAGIVNTAGHTATVNVIVGDPLDSTVQATAEYDLYTDTTLDLVMSLNGNTLASIADGSGVLTENTDYTVTDNTVTLSEAYLQAKAVGQETLTFTFSAGANDTTVITISDSTPVIPSGELLHAEAGPDFTGVLYANSGNIYYNQVNSSNIWGNEVLIGEGVDARLAIDNGGNPHVVYSTAGSIGYRMFDGSDWSEEELIESNNGGSCSKPDIAVDGAGVVHITYADTMGNSGQTTDTADIMYATDASGSFIKSIIYAGGFDDFGGGSGYAEYNEKGSVIAVDGTGNYYILAQRHIYNKAPGWTDHTYVAAVASNLGNGSTESTDTSVFDIYDITANGGKVVALYKHSAFKTAVLTAAGATISFDNIVQLTGSSVNTVVTDGTDVVTGGLDAGNLQIHYNGTPDTYGDVAVSGTKIAVVEADGTFSAVYTDNSDGKIKILAIQ